MINHKNRRKIEENRKKKWPPQANFFCGKKFSLENFFPQNVPRLNVKFRICFSTIKSKIKFFKKFFKFFKKFKKFFKKIF